jgi:small subunit ribosomal protein S6
LATVATSQYELILMLDPEASDELRDRIVSEARSRIEAAGTIKADSSWGMRNMAYEIDRRNEADYRFFRFESESALLNSLDHELKIADGVLRFRIFKVDPSSPVITPPAPTPGSGPPPRPARQDTPAEPAPEAEGSGSEEAEVPAAEPTPAAEEPAPEAPEVAPDGASDEVAVEPAEPAAPIAPEPDDTAGEAEDVGGDIPAPEEPTT